MASSRRRSSGVTVTAIPALMPNAMNRFGLLGNPLNEPIH
jgi:hypothetical protein